MDKLCTIERRTRMIDYLIYRKSSTRRELSEEFNVSVNTVVRDIEYISRLAPIFTRQGNGGGIFILPQYRSYKNYLTDKEDECLKRIMEFVTEGDKYILGGIIIKFSRYGEGE